MAAPFKPPASMRSSGYRGVDGAWRPRKITSMTDNRNRHFKYDWSRTWDDKPEDYVAHDGETSIGRVYRINSISTGGWFWTMNGTHRDRSGSYSGHVADRDAACDLVEQHWDMMKAGGDKSGDSSISRVIPRP